MKIEKVRDGMFEIEQYVWTTLELVNSPEEHREFMQELKRSDDPYYFLGKLRKGCEEKCKKLNDSDSDKVKRARRDLGFLHKSIEACDAAMREKQWKRAVRIAINVGGLAQKAKLRLQLEPEVLSGRKQRSGIEDKNADKRNKRRDRYRKYASDFNRIKAASPNRDNHPIVKDLAVKHGVHERTIYKALKEFKKTLTTQ